MDFRKVKNSCEYIAVIDERQCLLVDDAYINGGSGEGAINEHGYAELEVFIRYDSREHLKVRRVETWRRIYVRSCWEYFFPIFLPIDIVEEDSHKPTIWSRLFVVSFRS